MDQSVFIFREMYKERVNFCMQLRIRHIVPLLPNIFRRRSASG